MTIKQPSIILRAMVLGAQGVFFNMFFLTYLFSPRAAHRFVGHLEEQATYTYTQCIKDMEEGLVPEWNDMPAPKIAIVSSTQSLPCLFAHPILFAGLLETTRRRQAVGRHQSSPPG
jgi:hypothetical protein